MKAMSAREAKHHFGQLLDDARAAPVLVEKHGRPVVVVLAVEEYERLTGKLARRGQTPSRHRSSDSDIARLKNDKPVGPLSIELAK
jgi:prevent-host-death family protein